MKNLFFVFLISLFSFISGSLYADGCYLCGTGSLPHCKDYCRYRGEESWDNRHKCEEAGCKVSGTSSCPTAVNYKICNGQLEKLFQQNVAYENVRR